MNVSPFYLKPESFSFLMARSQEMREALQKRREERDAVRVPRLVVVNGKRVAP